MKVEVTYDPELDKYKDIVLFPEKLARANEILEKYGMPEEYIQRNKTSAGAPVSIEDEKVEGNLTTATPKS